MRTVWMIGLICVGCIQRHQPATDEEPPFPVEDMHLEADIGPPDMDLDASHDEPLDALPDMAIDAAPPPPVCHWEVTAEWITSATVELHAGGAYWYERVDDGSGRLIWYGIEGPPHQLPFERPVRVRAMTSGLVVTMGDQFGPRSMTWHVDWQTEERVFVTQEWPRITPHWLAWQVEDELFAWRSGVGRVALGRSRINANDLWIGEHVWGLTDAGLVEVVRGVEVLHPTDTAAVLRPDGQAQMVSWWADGRRWITNGDQRVAFDAPDRRPTLFPIWMPAADVVLHEDDDQEWGHRPRRMALSQTDGTLVSRFENVAEAWTVGDLLLLQTRFGWPDRVKLIDPITGRERLNLPGYDARPVPGPDGGRPEEWLLVPETNESARSAGPTNLVRSVGEVSEHIWTAAPRSGSFQRVFEGRAVVFNPSDDLDVRRIDRDTGEVTLTGIRARVRPFNRDWMMWQDDAADAPLMFEGFDGQRRAVPVPGRLMAHLGQNANRCEVVLLSQPQPDQRLRITRAVLPSL